MACARRRTLTFKSWSEEGFGSSIGSVGGGFIVDGEIYRGHNGTHPEATFPPEVQATLTVTRRDGENIELELREITDGMDITFLCRGRVTRNADTSFSLEFKSHGVKGNPNASWYITDVPYSAKITGDTIKGTWKYVEKDEGINLSGDYALTRE